MVVSLPETGRTIEIEKSKKRINLIITIQFRKPMPLITTLVSSFSFLSNPHHTFMLVDPYSLFLHRTHHADPVSSPAAIVPMRSHSANK
jgi:hypothetical protein